MVHPVKKGNPSKNKKKQKKSKKTKKKQTSPEQKTPPGPQQKKTKKKDQKKQMHRATRDSIKKNKKKQKRANASGHPRHHQKKQKKAKKSKCIGPPDISSKKQKKADQTQNLKKASICPIRRKKQKKMETPPESKTRWNGHPRCQMQPRTINRTNQRQEMNWIYYTHPFCLPYIYYIIYIGLCTPNPHHDDPQAQPQYMRPSSFSILCPTTHHVFLFFFFRIGSTACSLSYSFS